jgi:hypothetical protein
MRVMGEAAVLRTICQSKFLRQVEGVKLVTLIQGMGEKQWEQIHPTYHD